MGLDQALQNRQELIKKIGNDSAFLVVSVAVFIEEPDVDMLASEALTDGADDKKIDLIFLDRDARRIVFAQGYVSQKNSDSAPANKASDLNTACAWLVSGNVDVIPDKLRQILIECREAISAGEIDFIDLLYVHNLPESINVSRELQTVEDHFKNALQTEKILVKSHELGKSKIEHLFAAQESHIEVRDDIPFPSEVGIVEVGKTWNATVSTVSGEWIHHIYTKFGDKLYSANYRGFLGADGRRRVNSGIRDTVERAPMDFWAFNNGITILTQKIVRAKTSKGNEKITLKGISIINGAQTSGSIGSIDKARSSLTDLKVLCRIIECSDQSTIENIVRFNNTQNVITTWDRFSNDPDQIRLEGEFAELGYSYNRKRGFSTLGDQIGIEQVLQPLLAFHGRPQDAVRGRNQLFVQQPMYRNAFENKKSRHILFVYSLARAIDNKRLDLKQKSSDNKLIAVEQKQLDLLRNLNFKPFLMAVIANSLETLVGFPCDPITVGFRPNSAKGSSVTELAARWLPVVETVLPLLTAIVQPETFFRNLNEDDFLKKVKEQMDAMLAASQASDRFKTLSEMIGAS